MVQAMGVRIFKTVHTGPSSNGSMGWRCKLGWLVLKVLFSTDCGPEQSIERAQMHLSAFQVQLTRWKSTALVDIDDHWTDLAGFCLRACISTIGATLISTQHRSITKPSSWPSKTGRISQLLSQFASFVINKGLRVHRRVFYSACRYSRPTEERSYARNPAKRRNPRMNGDLHRFSGLPLLSYLARYRSLEGCFK
jgi:hypothetical protein